MQDFICSQIQHRIHRVACIIQSKKLSTSAIMIILTTNRVVVEWGHPPWTHAFAVAGPWDRFLLHQNNQKLIL